MPIRGGGVHTIALGCDFKRSTQHFVGKPLSRKNAFESEEWLKFQWVTERLPMKMLATCPTDIRIACFDGVSIANRLFEISVHPSATLVAPALTTRLRDCLARRPGRSDSSGCCVDPLRPQSLAAVQPNISSMSAFGGKAAARLQFFEQYERNFRADE